MVNYPALQNEWLPREPMALTSGTIGGTANHTGFFPQWKITLTNGYITRVEGGGVVGDLLREFLQYPNINDVTPAEPSARRRPALLGKLPASGSTAENAEHAERNRT
jgi:hypothetical protein